MGAEETQKKKHIVFRCAALSAAALYVLFGVASLFAPLPVLFPSAGREAYSCVWERRGETSETYFSAYSALERAEADAIVLQRAGERGRVLPTEEYRRAYAVLDGGNLGELYKLSPNPSRLEKAALWRAFGDRVWYDGGYFIWNGERIAVSGAEKRERFVLLNGSVSARTVIAAEAKLLDVRADAELLAPALLGTEIEEFVAEEPYASDGRALYLHTAGGTRLIAGAPAARSLTVCGNEFADEGALAQCERLEELAVPFAGNTLYTHTEAYRGEFACLFTVRGEYCVPLSLKRVTVTGGKLTSFAFYACPQIKEFNVCGLAAEDISDSAFLSCEGWEKIHCPNAKIRLPSAYMKSLLPCGCTLFERKG